LCGVFVGEKVMIEAVENHMPQTIVIDEIGTELEALAAGTIAQRGVQLVGTAHGMTVENLIKNPSLQMLVGGIQVCTYVHMNSQISNSKEELT
jgi:stage III sporulation protein SpoIIIAA